MTKFFMGADTEFGSLFGSVGHFISNAAHVAGKEMGHVVHGAQNAAGAVTHAVTKIPVVGAPLHTVFGAAYHATTAPLNMAVDVAVKGKRIDKAVMSQIHDHVKDIKTVAPYAQMVVSLVPGVGTGVSAALGAGLALANGQPIDKALMAGAIEALPGGPLAHAAASVAAAGVDAAARGEKVDLHSIAGTLVKSLPVSDAAKQALLGGATMAGHLAAGKSVDTAAADAALNTVLNQLPPDVRKAYQSGLAMGSAVVVQGHRATELVSPTVLNKLVESGIQAAKTVPAISEARRMAGPGVKGFDLATGLLTQHSRLFDIVHTRQTLKDPKDLMGFDMAMAARIGMVTQPARGKLSPGAQAGRAIVLGMQGMPKPDNKAAIMQAVSGHESGAVGAKVALNQVAVAREPLLVRVAHALHFDLGHRHQH